MGKQDDYDMVDIDEEILLFMQFTYGEIDADEYLQKLSDYDRKREENLRQQGLLYE